MATSVNIAVFQPRNSLNNVQRTVAPHFWGAPSDGARPPGTIAHPVDFVRYSWVPIRGLCPFDSVLSSPALGFAPTL